MKIKAKMIQHFPGWKECPHGRIKMERFYICEGASFSGWIVADQNDRFCYSDPISRAKDAEECAIAMCAEICNQ